ncbi:MAG: Crp/Fnr family transcriptional regulator, partial [Proteobacteria bacterium]|nr:Crp/Fnr family transcriptional regulator [Pseudomonadota bacterium]
MRLEPLLRTPRQIVSIMANNVRSLLNSPHDPRQNHLLAALPAEDFARLLPGVPMPLGHVLYEPGVQMRHVYFPTTSIVSLLYVMEDGASAEIAVVGNEGVVGVSLFMGGESTTSRAVVQSDGYAYRLKAQLLKDEFFRAGPMQRLLLRYTQALLTQMAQTAVCNRHHSLDQQFCRWLLLSLDRLSSNELVMTQELIANMLGVRREGVTEAAGNVQRAGLISYNRPAGPGSAGLRVLRGGQEGVRPPASLRHRSVAHLSGGRLTRPHDDTPPAGGFALCATAQTAASFCAIFQIPILRAVPAAGSQPPAGWHCPLLAGILTIRSAHVPRTQSVPAANRLIDALPRKDRQRFLAACEPVDLVFSEILAEPGERIRHVYFPTASIVS